MKKTVLCLLALLLLFALCGCTESEIACGVDGEDRAFLRYDWELDLRELAVREQVPILAWLRERAAALEKQGFTVNHNAVAVTQSMTYLRAELTRQGGSRAEAFSLLREMLTDESLTPFTAVACEALPQELQEAYRVSLRLEPDRVLATAGTESWPKRLREQVSPWIESGSVRVTVSLPATELPEQEDAALADGLAVKALSVPLNGSGELSLSTVYYAGGGENAQVWWRGTERTAENADALGREIEHDRRELERFERIMLLSAVVLASAALILFTVGTARRRARRAAARSRAAAPAAIIGGADAPTALVLSAVEPEPSDEGGGDAAEVPVPPASVAPDTGKAPDPSEDPEPAPETPDTPEATDQPAAPEPPEKQDTPDEPDTAPETPDLSEDPEPAPEAEPRDLTTKNEE